MDTGISAGRELLALARETVAGKPSSSATEALVAAVGPEAAMTAVEVASAFAMTNRAVEATGQPVIRREREAVEPILASIGALDFPHSGVETERLRTTRERYMHRLKRRLRAKRPSG